MGNDIKSGFGYIIPVAALIGFVFALAAEEFLLSVFFAAGGILVWFIYMQVMETTLPPVMGNFIILFSIMIATGLFLAFGLNMNPHGGYEIIPEGSILAFVILFFGVLAGILFNRSNLFDQDAKNELTAEEEKAVVASLKDDKGTGDSPRIVVIKSDKSEEKKNRVPETPPPFYHNPYYYPEDYEYEDDDEYDDEDDDEYDDEYEYEDEFEDEYEDEEEENR